jgi:type I restriction enzyme S subunit
MGPSIILSAYDDLIENNTRRIKILEEMAQAIYCEWFVHFRFPGHEQVAMIDSPLGSIPEGWEVKRFRDIVSLSRDGINPSKFEVEIFSHLSIPAFDEGCMPIIEQGKTIKSNKFLLPNDCVLLSKINPRIPRVWIPCFDNAYRAVSSTEFLVLVLKPFIPRAFLFSLCKSNEFLKIFAGLALGTSTSHQRVKSDDLLNLQILLPPKSLRAAFNDIARPNLDMIQTLRLKNANLRRTRDLLLPKLISGEVDVEGLEIETGEVGACSGSGA